LMVGEARILNKEIFSEAHKRKQASDKVETQLLIDLSHTIENGLVT
jgi:arylformamidase